MSAKVTRRDFLRSVALGTAGFTISQLLEACSAPQIPVSQSTPSSPSATPTLRSTSPTSKQTSTSQPPTSPTSTTSDQTTKKVADYDLVVARNGEPEELVRRALAAIGGIDKFVPKGAWVIIKPNICVAYHTYEYAATTNPWVVGELVKQCLDAGASKVQVLDNPFGGTAKAAYAISGIEQEVTKAGGEMVTMSRLKFSPTEIPRGADLHELDIYEDVIKADVLINVPIAKHHGLARLTLGMKNLMGTIRRREIIHANLGQRLADLTSVIQPTLTVIDAIRILMNNGPTGGDLGDVKKLDTLIISQDIVAADSYAATLFGLEPGDLSYIKAGAEMGLGRSDIRNLKIEEINVAA